MAAWKTQLPSFVSIRLVRVFYVVLLSEYEIFKVVGSVFVGFFS